MPNYSGWLHDGTRFRVYCDDELVLEVPLPFVSGTPSHSVVIDPDTGLPAVGEVAAEGSHGGGLPAGTDVGDLLWWDGTAWRVLVPDDTPGHVLTEVAREGGGVTPTWTGVGSHDVLPDPDQVRCGAADQMMQNLDGFYSNTIAMLQMIMDGLAEKSLVNLSGVLANWVGTDPLVLGQFGAVLNFLIGEIEILAPLVTYSLLPPLFAIDKWGLRCLIFNQLPLPDETGHITVTAGMITAIHDGAGAVLTTNSNWVSDATRGAQIAVLRSCINAITLANWQGWCDVGVNAPQGLCAECVGGIA